MAGAVFKNIAPGARFERGDVARVAFAQEHTYAARDASFAGDFGALWSKLFELSVDGIGNPGVPITRNAVTRGMTTTVADFRITRPVPAADLVAAIDNVSGFYVKVASVEKLTPAAAQAAASNAGAAQRDAVRVQEQAEQDTASWWNQLAKATGTTLSVIKWVAVAVVVIAVIVYAGPLLKKGK